MTAMCTAAPVARRPALAAWLRALASRVSPHATDADEARASQAFVQEMIACNPDAFRNDLDVQAMMQHFPNRF